MKSERESVQFFDENPASIRRLQTRTRCGRLLQACGTTTNNAMSSIQTRSPRKDQWRCAAGTQTATFDNVFPSLQNISEMWRCQITQTAANHADTQSQPKILWSLHMKLLEHCDHDSPTHYALHNKKKLQLMNWFIWQVEIPAFRTALQWSSLLMTNIIIQYWQFLMCNRYRRTVKAYTTHIPLYFSYNWQWFFEIQDGGCKHFMICCHIVRPPLFAKISSMIEKWQRLPEIQDDGRRHLEFGHVASSTSYKSYVPNRSRNVSTKDGEVLWNNK